MSALKVLIHAGSNDDRWYLCRGEEATDVFVFHEPNGPSGGLPARVELPVFLAHGVGSPEHRALLAMIGSLAACGDAKSADRVTAAELGAAGAEPSPGEEVVKI